MGACMSGCMGGYGFFFHMVSSLPSTHNVLFLVTLTPTISLLPTPSDTSFNFLHSSTHTLHLRSTIRKLFLSKFNNFSNLFPHPSTLYHTHQPPPTPTNPLLHPPTPSYTHQPPPTPTNPLLHPPTPSYTHQPPPTPTNPLLHPPTPSYTH